MLNNHISIDNNPKYGDIGNGNMQTPNHFHNTTNQQKHTGKKREKERGRKKGTLLTGRLRIQRILHAITRWHQQTHPPFTNLIQTILYIFPKRITYLFTLRHLLHIFSPLFPSGLGEARFEPLTDVYKNILRKNWGGMHSEIT